MLELKDVTVHFPGNEHDSLTNINLTFEESEFVCILGQSGAGKSTLIRCFNGLQKPSTGEVYYHGLPLSKMNEEQLRKIRREMGMIFQHFNLIPRLSVRHNVMTGMFGYRKTLKNLLGLFNKEEVMRAKQTITDVGLAPFISRRIEHLSGGQKQRVGIARAIIQQPKVLLGDEPVSSLDPGTADHVFTLIKELHKRHQLLTIINVHDVSIAKKYASRIVALKQGKVIFDGEPEDFIEADYQQTYM